jgi:hypothetical protein
MGVNPLIQSHTPEYFRHSSVTPDQQAIEDIVTNGLGYEQQQKLIYSDAPAQLQFHLGIMDFRTERRSAADMLFDATEEVMRDPTLNEHQRAKMLSVIPSSYLGAVQLYMNTK